MLLKLFSGVFSPGAEGALELEVNNWFNQEEEANLVNMAVNMSHSDGKIAVFITVLYEYGGEDLPDIGEMLQAIGPRRRNYPQG